MSSRRRQPAAILPAGWPGVSLQCWSLIAAMVTSGCAHFGAPTTDPGSQAEPLPTPKTGSVTNSLPALSRAQAESALQNALGVRPIGSNLFALGEVIVDAQRRAVIFPARVNMRGAIIEYALVTTFGKTHESLLVTDVEPQQLHLACLLLGLGPGRLVGPPDTAEAVPFTNAVVIEVSWTNGAKHVRRALSELVAIKRPNTELPGTPLSAGPWYYNGSEMGESGFSAQVEGSIISLIRDPAALVNNPRRERDDDEAHVPNAKRVPLEGTPVRVELRLSPPKK